MIGRPWTRYEKVSYLTQFECSAIAMQDLRGRCPHLFTFAGTYADAMMLLIRKNDVIGVGHHIGECLGRFLHTYHQRWNGWKRCMYY